MSKKREDHELPPVIQQGWRFHHLGLPVKEKHPDEYYLETFKMYVSGFDKNPFGIERMRFEPDSPVHSLIQSQPHLAFEVDDLEAALAGRKIIGDIGSPSPGVRVAMIVDDGLPIELLEFDQKINNV